MKDNINDEIKKNIYALIENYKKGTPIQQKSAIKIQDIADHIHCFHCLDTKESWNYRGKEYKNDGKGEYYKMNCSVCPNDTLKNKWIEDSHVSEIYSSLGIKLFHKDSFSGNDRFNELLNYAIKIYPELSEPLYEKSISKNIQKNIKTYQLDIEIGKIINQCKNIFASCYSDLSSYLNILNNIQINISSLDSNNQQDNEICEELHENYFIFIKIHNNSSVKKKSILGLYHYNKYKLDISIDIHEIKTLNDSAYDLCQAIVNKSAEKNIESLNTFFL